MPAPTHSNVNRKAALSLDFLIIGGGIGGLAAALTLAKGGHRVRVLERRDLSAPSFGVRIPPNFSKILRRWAGEDEFLKLCTRCVGSPFHYVDGSFVGYVHWKPAVLAETGGDFLLIHREDLVRLLHKLALEAGARIDFNTEVVSIHAPSPCPSSSPSSPNAPRPSITLASGETLSADILIGADGARSRVREVVLGREDAPRAGGLTLYTGIVEGERMLRDPELRPFLLSDEWPMLMGEGRSVSGHSVHAKKQFYISVYSHAADSIPQGHDETWEEVVPPSFVARDQLDGFVKRLVDMPTSFIRTAFMDRDPIEDWVDESGRIVLLGDAAHPTMPGGSHSCSMAVEDAVVLGALFSHLSQHDQIPSFLSAYQELRARRTASVRAADVGTAVMLVLPRGPVQAARDEDLRRRKDDWDEGTIKEQFESIAEIFLYDAYDAAEEWWLNWGRFSEGARAQPHTMTFNFSTVTVECS